MGHKIDRIEERKARGTFGHFDVKWEVRVLLLELGAKLSERHCFLFVKEAFTWKGGSLADSFLSLIAFIALVSLVAFLLFVLLFVSGRVMGGGGGGGWREVGCVGRDLPFLLHSGG